MQEIFPEFLLEILTMQKNNSNRYGTFEELLYSDSKPINDVKKSKESSDESLNSFEIIHSDEDLSEDKNFEDSKDFFTKKMR